MRLLLTLHSSPKTFFVTSFVPYNPKMKYAILLLGALCTIANCQLDFSTLLKCDIEMKAAEIVSCQMPVMQPIMDIVSVTQTITKGQLCKLQGLSLDCLTQADCLTPEVREMMDLTVHLKKAGIDCNSDVGNSEELLNFADCTGAGSEKLSQCLATLSEITDKFQDKEKIGEILKMYGCKLSKQALSCVKGCVKFNPKYDYEAAIMSSMKAQGFDCE